MVEKDTRLDHLQKWNDELSTFLTKAKEDAVVEFSSIKLNFSHRFAGHQLCGRF